MKLRDGLKLGVVVILMTIDEALMFSAQRSAPSERGLWDVQSRLEGGG